MHGLLPVPKGIVPRVHGACIVPKGIVRDAAQFVPAGLPLLAETQIISAFGYCSNPFGGGVYEFHNGVAAPEGTPVCATATGTVRELGWNPIFGLMILIDRSNRACRKGSASSKAA